MNANEIVKGILSGSAAIDRMRKEVDDVVRIIDGLLKNELPIDFNTKFTSERSEWSIRKHPLNGGKVYFEVKCCIRLSLGWQSGYSLRGEVPFHSENVQEVHECLPDFIQGVAKEFPSIEERWQFLLKAAEK
jgi:hypothetical protein